MDPLELAKSMEKAGIEYYEKLAKETPMKELRGIFSVLAKEEARHYEMFSALQKKQAQNPFESGTSAAQAKAIFENLTKQFSMPETTYDYAMAYSKALEMEQKSISLYEEMLGKATTADDKKVLSFLITEEQKHEHLLEHLIEFVNEPNIFLDTAEFNHLADN